MRRLTILLAFALTFAITFVVRGQPATTNNDDSCDIGVAPAATLLLPYFEVETASRGTDTLFTVTNVTPLPQIAKVTIWTDWAFPVLSFSIFLTGYDVQSVSLYDVIVRGALARTSSETIPGRASEANTDNPNIAAGTCATLPGALEPAIARAVRDALTAGIYDDGPRSCGKTPVGSPSVAHRTVTTAVGYVTIDVTSRCSPTLGNDAAYFADEILYDNVLTGDTISLDRMPGNNYAGGNPLVHIRAVPEGGRAGAWPAAAGPVTALPYTFYGRYINGQSVANVPLPPHLDRRQPLPVVFAARYIQGGATSFNTLLKIWREGIAGPTTCATASSNNRLPAEPSMGYGSDFIRFDEHENGQTFAAGQIILIPSFSIELPAASRVSTASASFPVLNSPSGDNSGWLYLSLDHRRVEPTINKAAHPGFTRRPSQNWVVVSMTGGSLSTAGLFGVEFDATYLGNGCSPAPGLTVVNGGTSTIGPLPNVNP